MTITRNSNTALINLRKNPRFVIQALMEAKLYLEAPPDSIRLSPVSRANLYKLICEALGETER